MVRSTDPNRIFADINRSLERAVDSIFEEINNQVRALTPIRTGRARSGWRKVVGKYRIGDSGVIIENPISYIGILDQGSSKQAPNGIVKPVLTRVLRRRTKL